MAVSGPSGTSGISGTSGGVTNYVYIDSINCMSVKSNGKNLIETIAYTVLSFLKLFGYMAL